jgi:HAD superfamily hydrolase (TIGR01509 family)
MSILAPLKAIVRQVARSNRYSPVKAVIFDVDGTLIDSVHLHAKAWQEAFLHFGYEFPFHEIRSQIGKGGDQLLPFFLSDEQVKVEGAEIEKYRGNFFKKEFLPKVRPFAKVRSLFERLSNDGWALALASSAKKKEVQTYAEICGISDLLQKEVSSDDAKKSKPYPDIFLAAMKSLGEISPEHCIVIGDSPFDAEAAGKAGIRSVGFLSGGFQEDLLRRAGFEAIYWGTPDLFAKYDQSVFHLERRALASRA